MPSLRQRLETSTFLANVLARLVGGYLRFCNWSIRWDVEGKDALAAELAEGPILLVCWHERSLMAPLHWPLNAGQLTSLYASSPIGRVSGAMQRRFGLMPMEMHNTASNVAASRAILKRVKEGVSIGLTADGPLGPALEVKEAPLDWARATQRPVWVYHFDTSRGRALDTWDMMWMPSPFGRGRIVFRRWDVDVPRRVDADGRTHLKQALSDSMDAAR